MNSSTTPTAPTDTRQVDRLLAHYGESHQNPCNELIHFIAIPLIMLSLVGMLFALHPYAAYAFVAASMLYYARLSIVFLLAMVLWSLVTFALVFAMGPWVWQMSIAVFVGAWVMQFIGHKIEGKKPSFLDDLKFLLIGPIWLIHFIFKKLGIRY